MEKVSIIIAIVVVVVVFVFVVVSSHSLFLPGISTFVPKLIPTALSSSFRLKYFPFYVRYSKHSYGFFFISEIWVIVGCGGSCCFFVYVPLDDWGTLYDYVGLVWLLVYANC